MMFVLNLLCALLLLSLSSTSTGSKFAGITILSNKLRSEQLPLFEFSRDVDKLLTNGASANDVENTFYEYLDLLQDFYLNNFRSLVSNNPNDAQKYKLQVLTEFATAIKGSIPPTLEDSWSGKVRINRNDDAE